MADTTADRPVALAALDLPARKGTGYPAPLGEIAKDRLKRAMGDPFGLTQYGVNLVHLPPGQASSQRHWHEREDEFVYVLEGELVLVTEAGETAIGPGMCAGFAAGRADGHHLVNRSGEVAVYLEVGSRFADERGHYPDVDLAYEKRDGRVRFTRRDGSPYET